VPEGRHDLAQARHGYSVAPADVDASQQGDVGGHVVILIPSIPVDNYCCGVIDDVAVLPYNLAFLVVLIAPGPDFALVVRNAGRCGRPAGVATAAGIASGLSVHAGIVAVGSGAMIAASAVAFTVVKIAGAAYLVVLGLVTLIGTFRRRPGSGSAAGDERRAPVDEPGASLSLGRAYRQGLLQRVEPEGRAHLPGADAPVPSREPVTGVNGVAVGHHGALGDRMVQVGGTRRGGSSAGVAATSGAAGIGCCDRLGADHLRGAGGHPARPLTGAGAASAGSPPECSVLSTVHEPPGTGQSGVDHVDVGQAGHRTGRPVWDRGCRLLE